MFKAAKPPSTTIVVAISLSEFASKTDEIFRCKKHTILAGSGWSYIFAIKVQTKISLYASTNNKTGIQ